MDFEGEITVAAPRTEVFEEMQKPEMLGRTMPNCESVEQVGENTYKVLVSEKISKISLELENEIEITDLQEYDLVEVEINGTAPGTNTSARGTGTFELTEADGGSKTDIHYIMEIDVSGKLASIGFRMLKHVVTNRIDQMAENIKAVFEEPEADAEQ